MALRNLFCAGKNKGDAKEPPYNKAKSPIEQEIDEGSALLQDEKNKTRVAREDLAKLQSDYNNVRRQLDSANTDLAAKSKTLKEQSPTKLRDLEDEVKEYKRKLEDTEKAKDAAEVTKVELETKLKKAADSTDGAALSLQTGISKEVTTQLESELKDLKNVKEQIEEERDSVKKKLKDEEESKRSAVSQLESQLAQKQKAIDEVEEKLKTFKRDKDNVEIDLAHTKKQLEIANRESHIPRSPTGPPSDECVNKLKTAEAELKKERDQRLEKEKELSRLINEKEQLSKEKDEILQQIQSLQAQTEDMRKNLENEGRNHRTEMDRIRQEHKKVISEKDATNDHLLTRLSSATAAQVLDGNPNVSDLSDPNRPQKLGEQMSTLYDDEWTDASEELEKQDKFKDDEKEIVKTLFELIKSVFEHCKEASDNQLSRIEEHIFLPPLESPKPSSPDTNGTDLSPVKSPSSKSASKIPRFSSQKSRPALPNLNPGKKTVEPNAGKDTGKIKINNTGSKVKGETVPEIPVEVRKGIKDYRKKVAKQVIPVIENEVLQKLQNNPDFGDEIVKACKPYITKCVEICWLMCVQDPPVCLKWDIPTDNKFDSDRYRAYTKSGSQVDYLVWPIVYLFDGGSILMKGVAQGK